jgi:hypothetical protein
MRTILCPTVLSLVLLAAGSGWATTTVTSQTCSDASQCYDGNSCTTDACTGGVCTWTDDTACGPFLDFPVRGKKIKLQIPPFPDDWARGFRFLATEGQLSYSPSPGNLPDPTQQGEFSGNPYYSGGSLRIFTTEGSHPFDHTYPLPPITVDPNSRHWDYFPMNNPGALRGYQYKDSHNHESQIGVIKIIAGKTVRMRGKGNSLLEMMPFNLDGPNPPDPVQVVLTVGVHRYCWSMGLVGSGILAREKFKPDLGSGAIYWVKNTDAPAACP